ncbi:MAG: prohibitin family protein [Ignavibacteriae bacterium]|nr:prohibitin family protein [Ignavibacteriota bacterium]MCB9207748.1 prohibitin family protein [Ignavibacteriales bacterium]MCB9258518.1 prohibitin family protein [Ignavibacteriales bacterium]
MFFIVGIIAAVVFFLIHLNVKKARRLQEATITLIIAIGSLIFSAAQVFTVIPAGTVGVVDFLGMVSDNTLKPGVNLVNPLARIIKYSFKTQELKETMTVPSKEGLPVQLEISLLYRVDPAMANDIYKTVEAGDYLNVILIPQFRSVVRGVTAKFEAKALYTEAREQLANEITSELQKMVAQRGITVESAPLRQIALPPRLTQSIEEKLQAEQESQRMSFILQKEKQEADRKRIEAKGIADFQSIVSDGINANLLKWKGIEATEKLANSQNSKVVVIGAGKDGLPLILGND